MQIDNYATFPAKVNIVVEDEIFLYPFMISPIFLSNQNDIEAVNSALENNSLIMIVPSKENHKGERSFSSCYDAGVIGTIMRKVMLPDSRVKILFQGLAKGKIIEELDEHPLSAIVDIIRKDSYNELKINAVLEILREKTRTLSATSGLFPPDLLRTIEENHDPDRIADLISSTIKIKKDQAYKLFIETNIETRLLKLIEIISQEIKLSKLQREIKSKVHSKIDKVNKEYFLKEQLKEIQKELGIDTQRDEEIEEYRQKLNAKKKFMNKEAIKEVEKQINRFAKIHPDSSDANVIQSYLDWVLEIPFGRYSKKKVNIEDVKRQLDADHYSLKKPKERSEEYFAVRELIERRGIKRVDKQGEIICFVGPPGVGKTSLANSIAKALKRKLVRIALGGLEDVNELRGHRRTYIGAMPGRIVQSLIEAKEMDPVIVLDEIDKVARSHRGDPTAVLLEILDPEQNDNFRDYFLNFNIDLSKIIFIATANQLSSIPSPLRDRMEFIYLSSYTPQEKYEIAKKYLIPQELKKHGLKNAEVNITKSALELIISDYTREAGVRNLRRRVADILRKVAKELLEDSSKTKVTISVRNLSKYLDKEVFSIEPIDKKDSIGIVNGLAWTRVGGDVLKIEAIKTKGKGSLQLTGSLGDVMKESAKIALSVVSVLIDKKFSKKSSNENSQLYKNYDLHIHVPEGATKKDGPSAGIAMATVIFSILLEKKIKANVGMTGELTLTGLVLPIGGLKEKLIAAHKAKIDTVLIPQKNYERDLDEIPDEVSKALKIIPVKTIEDVLKIAIIS